MLLFYVSSSLVIFPCIYLAHSYVFLHMTVNFKCHPQWATVPGHLVNIILGACVGVFLDETNICVSRLRKAVEP